MRAPAPAWAADLNGATIELATATLGAALIDAVDQVGEVALYVEREAIVAALTALRDTPGLKYQQLMDIAGVDYPSRAERFDVVYCLLSLTRNHRLHVHVAADDVTPVPSVTGIWPVAGWLEREVYDMYGVTFAGNSDLRRILTDYGFEGFPQRKDFPLTGYVELRYSEVQKRVVYEPVSLPQDSRTFDFLMPWEGPEYRLPGDEKATPEQPGAPSPAPAPGGESKQNPPTVVDVPKTTARPSQTGAGKPADKAAKAEARKPRAAKKDNAGGDDTSIPEPSPTKGKPRRPDGSAA